MLGRKTDEARRILSQCLGFKGVWASPERYSNQCWTRDFVIAAEPYLLSSNYSYHQEIVRRHLNNLAQRQAPNGQIPIMFLDNTLSWLAKKIWRSIRNRRMSFLLKAFLRRDGVASLSPWTRDSELLFILGLAQFAHYTDDRMFLSQYQDKIRLAISYIDSNLIKDGLIYGVDWRDTRPDLDDKALLTNNCLLYQTYFMLGEIKRAEALKDRINQDFWTGAHYRDYPGTDDFDTLGNALAILFNIAPVDYQELIFAKVAELDTPFGYKLNGVTLPTKSRVEAEIMAKTNQHGVIWPFIHEFMVLALLKQRKRELAEKQFVKFDMVDGFYEWYDPITGKGYGSRDQMWSGALYLRALAALSQRTE